MERILQSWQTMANAGGEVGVTLVMGGRLYRGQLSPLFRWHEWYREVLGRARAEGGSFKIPDGGLRSLSKEERDRYMEILEESARASESEPWEGDEADEEAPAGLGALKNAEMFSEALGHWIVLEFVLIDLRKVEAFLPGVIDLEVTRDDSE